MKTSSSKLRWALPVLQMLFAWVLFVFASYQFRAASLGEIRPERLPPFAERVSWAINFPARVLMAPINRSALFEQPIYVLGNGPFRLVITPNDLVWFVSVFCFWYFIADELCRLLNSERDSTAAMSRLKPIGATRTTIGLVWALATGWLGTLALYGSRGYQQVGVIGIGWCLLLAVYYGYHGVINRHRLYS